MQLKSIKEQGLCATLLAAAHGVPLKREIDSSVSAYPVILLSSSKRAHRSPLTWPGPGKPLDFWDAYRMHADRPDGSGSATVIDDWLEARSASDLL